MVGMTVADPEDRGSGRQAEAAAFIELLRLHDRGMCMLAHRMLHQQTAVDDVLQDASVKAFRGSSEPQGEAQTRTWLYRIVYNACLDRLRREKREREMSSGSDGIPEYAPSCSVAYLGARSRNVVDREETEPMLPRADLDAALACLPEDQRAAVLLVDGLGFSSAETAEVLGVRPSTIGPRLNHARSVLQATLAEERTMSGHDDEPYQDPALGEELQRLQIPDHGPDFFFTLQQRLQAEAEAGRAESDPRRGRLRLAWIPGLSRWSSGTKMRTPKE